MTHSQPTILALSFEDLYRSEYPGLVAVATAYLARLRREEPSTPGPSVEVLAFWSAVRDLPTRPRLAVALRYAGDRSVAEIASILDVPEGTVTSDLSRARLALKGAWS